MEGFKKGFYTTSQKQERKPEATLSQSSFTRPQPFSQQLGTQTQEEQKHSKKVIHIITPTSQEKPRKKAKSALHQEISEFNPSGQMSMEQLVIVVLNLQEKVKKLKKDNEKLIQQLDIAEGIEQRLLSQERELSAFWNISQDQNDQSQNQLQKQAELDNRLKKIEEKLNEQKEIQWWWNQAQRSRRRSQSSKSKDATTTILQNTCEENARNSSTSRINTERSKGRYKNNKGRSASYNEET